MIVHNARVSKLRINIYSDGPVRSCGVLQLRRFTKAGQIKSKFGSSRERPLLFAEVLQYGVYIVQSLLQFGTALPSSKHQFSGHENQQAH